MKSVIVTFGFLLIYSFACSEAAIGLRCKSHCEHNEETDYHVRGKPYACNCEVVRTTNEIKEKPQEEAPKAVHKRSTSDEDDEEEPKKPNIFRLISRNSDSGRNFNLLDMSTKHPILEKIIEKLDEFKNGMNSEESILGNSLLDYKGLMPHPIALPPLEDILQKHVTFPSPRTPVLDHLRSHVDNFMDHFDKPSFPPNIPTFGDLERHVNKINLNMRMDGSNPLIPSIMKPNWGLLGSENPEGKFGLLSRLKGFKEDEPEETEEEEAKEEKREETEEPPKDNDENVNESPKIVIKSSDHKIIESTTPTTTSTTSTTTTMTIPEITKKAVFRKHKKERLVGSAKEKPKAADEVPPIAHVPGIIVQPKEFMGEDNP